MKRDMELVRKLLLELENMEDYGRNRRGFLEELTGEPENIIWYHFRVMEDAGLIIRDSTIVRLTWEGHEFLEAVRDEKRWEKVKAKLDKGGGFVYALVKATAVDLLEEEINPNGVNSLRTQLTQRYNNLNALEEQAANYPAVNIPLELRNQITKERLSYLTD